MYIYYQGDIINTNLTFDINTSNTRIRFYGPAENRYVDIFFEDKRSTLLVLNEIYKALDKGWISLDIQKDILDKLLTT